MDGPAWHGPALRELLSGVTAAQAGAKFSSAHSIWEIVLHSTAWQRAVTRRLAGDTIDLSPEQDWPPVPATGESGWAGTLSYLYAAHTELQDAIAALDDSRLDQIIFGTPAPCSIYATLHGLIQHNLYHAGQIAILKRLNTSVE